MRNGEEMGHEVVSNLGSRTCWPRCGWGEKSRVLGLVSGLG